MGPAATPSFAKGSNMSPFATPMSRPFLRALARVSSKASAAMSVQTTWQEEPKFAFNSAAMWPSPPPKSTTREPGGGDAERMVLIICVPQAR
eukprot:CAMPEP_0180484458 /NCGR_PEP_ID=MMETSP1036_2-20121128/35954_1 /TAXON_ID=632150 /ORGANISM="Azadinium spinosum, Strain 3D9" /LENGTH=91 /DNA_ID=CAMNT_0022492309 /DNA_START=100 /DNA_END=375 /DNA_ORIENTATION=+